MLQHLGLLFGRAMTGRIELTAIKVTDEGEHVAPRTRFFRTDELEDAAEWAFRTNSEHMWNVYVGAATRINDVFPGKAATDADFHMAWAIHADVDGGHDLDAVRATYRAAHMTPPFIVVTGRTPTTRAQMWWPLEEPLSDPDEYRRTLRGVAQALNTDPAVTAAKQLMRLGGGINWPKKADRVMERTELHTPPHTLASFPIEQIHRAFPPADVGSGGGVTADIEVAPVGALGLQEQIMDGREGYAFRLIRAHMREWMGTTGTEPTADEIYKEVAPIYLAKADQVRPGRGPEWLKHKVADAIRSFEAGLIPGMKDLEEAVQTWAAKGRGEGVDPLDNDSHPDDDGLGQSNKPPALIEATPYQWVDACKIPPRDLLYGRHFFRKFLSVTVSPGGLGKSSNAIVEALAMVTGRTLLGEDPKSRLSVWYWNGEDPAEELQRRIAAAALHYGIKADDLAGRLYVDSGRDTEITIAREVRGDFEIAVPMVDALIETVRANQIDVLIVDPFVASHAVSENDNTKIEGVVRQWMRVAEAGGCAVELVHHVRKPGGGGNQETTVDDARGAGALLAKARSARVLNAMSLTEADEVGIERKDRWSFFRIDNGKSNLMPRGGDAAWRRMVGVSLGNRIDAREDNVGVATQWTKPSAFEGVKEHHLYAARSAIAAGEWRENVQSANWVGVPIAGVLGVDLEDAQGKSKVKEIVRTWIKEGVLEVVNGFDHNRKPKLFVVVGKDI
jgi:hypothetical protein